LAFRFSSKATTSAKPASSPQRFAPRLLLPNLPTRQDHSSPGGHKHQKSDPHRYLPEPHGFRHQTPSRSSRRIFDNTGMPMTYRHSALTEIPIAADPAHQHLLDTYASETNKTYSVWNAFPPDALPYRPHPKSSTVQEIFSHQLLSERRFFGEFLGTPEPPPAEIIPLEAGPAAYAARLVELARPRLAYLAGQSAVWWLQRVPFFDVERERIWVFWRRVLHTAHHRTQLTVYQRLLGNPVLPTYGPTADITWDGADPTSTVDAAGRSAKP